MGTNMEAMGTNTGRNAVYVPYVLERTAQGGEFNIDLPTKLFRERIIFLGDYITSDVANIIISELLVLQQDSPDEDISMYINCQGGSSTAISAIYDTMNFISNDVSTLCIGAANDASSILLSAGTPGKRFILPNATVRISQPVFNGIQGKVSFMNVYADEMKRIREWFTDTLHKHTGKAKKTIATDLENGKILTAKQAQAYGIVDRILDQE